MIVEFDDRALEHLFLFGTADDRNYRRLPEAIVKSYVKVVNYIRAARRIEDLYLIKSLHYEKKRGTLKDKEAVWINDQYRLIFKSSANRDGIKVNALLIEISKHYE